METDTTNMALTHRSYTRFYGVVFVLGATVAFSSKSIWIKLLYLQPGNIDAISILALRMAFAIPFYLVVILFLYLQKGSRVFPGRIGSLVLLAFLGYYLSSFLDISGLAYIPAGLERMILYLYPTIVVVMVAQKNNRRIRRNEIVSLACSYFGITLIFFNGFTANLPHLVLGSLLVLGAAISFSVYSVNSAEKIHELGTLRFTTWTMLIGALMTLLHFVASKGIAVPSYSSHVYMLAAALALTGTVIPSFMMAEGIRRIGADRTALLGSLGPLATIFLAMEVLSEPVSTVELAGSAVVIFGVLNLARTAKSAR